MRSNLIANADMSQLLMIDMQTKLLRAMAQDEAAVVLHNCQLLATAANLLHIPIVVSEQYPQGLGPTEPTLLAELSGAPVVEKITFSCAAEPALMHHITASRSQLLIAGMEAHICVLQSAIDFKLAGQQVFVVEDAILSRKPGNKANAIARLRDAGCIVTNTESVLFEWLGVAQGDAFKALSKLIR